MNLSCTLGQKFGGNANPLYSKDHLAGHPGVDESCGYGSDIHSYVKGQVYSEYPVNAPAKDGYTAIFMICKTPLEVFEFSYGHVSEIDVKIGDSIEVGQLLGKEGNKGEVYSGNVLVTLAQQAAGNHSGAHRHVQKRPVIVAPTTFSGERYLQTSRGLYRDDDGLYYQIVNYENGYNGCVDWMAPLFARDLFLGCIGYDVYLLQGALRREGFFSGAQTFTFGPKTMAALISFQKKYNLTPPLGYCGMKTRVLLNSQYSQLS